MSQNAEEISRVLNTKKPACNGTERDWFVTALSRFSLIQVLEIGLKVFLQSVSACAHTDTKVVQFNKEIALQEMCIFAELLRFTKNNSYEKRTFFVASL